MLPTAFPRLAAACTPSAEEAAAAGVLKARQVGMQAMVGLRADAEINVRLRGAAAAMNRLIVSQVTAMLSKCDATRRGVDELDERESKKKKEGGVLLNF
jgi:hypothetical protein